MSRVCLLDPLDTGWSLDTRSGWWQYYFCVSQMKLPQSVKPNLLWDQDSCISSYYLSGFTWRIVHITLHDLLPGYFTVSHHVLTTEVTFWWSTWINLFIWIAQTHNHKFMQHTLCSPTGVLAALSAPFVYTGRTSVKQWLFYNVQAITGLSDKCPSANFNNHGFWCV